MSSKGKKNRTIDGHTFDSDLEFRYYKEVVLQGLRDGTIKHCELQVKYLLQPKFEKMGKKYREINYVADFVLTYTNGDLVVIDTKGLPDATAKIKKKMMDYHYPNLNYIWVGYSKNLADGLNTQNLKKGENRKNKIRKMRANYICQK